LALHDVDGAVPGDRLGTLRVDHAGGALATVQVGCQGRSVTEVAADLGCGWHAVMDAVEL
jgi:hypothetical protein